MLNPRHRSHTIDAFHEKFTTRRCMMEDHQEQEYEFWRRLEEEQLDRKKLLKRGLAAGAGLTIFSLSDVALAARQRALADPPMRGKAMSLKELIAQAKKESRSTRSPFRPTGRTTARSSAPSRRSTGSRSRATTRTSSAEENQTVRQLKGDPRAPDVLDVSPSFAIGRQRGSLREVLHEEVQEGSAGDEGQPRVLGRRLLGCRLVRRQHGRRHRPCRGRSPTC